MPEKVEAWECSFGCRFISTDIRYVKQHERVCLKNPDRKVCGRCRFLEKLYCIVNKRRISWPATDSCKKWEDK